MQAQQPLTPSNVGSSLAFDVQLSGAELTSYSWDVDVRATPEVTVSWIHHVWGLPAHRQAAMPAVCGAPSPAQIHMPTLPAHYAGRLACMPCSRSKCCACPPAHAGCWNQPSRSLGTCERQPAETLPARLQPAHARRPSSTSEQAWSTKCPTTAPPPAPPKASPGPWTSK